MSDQEVIEKLFSFKQECGCDKYEIREVFNKMGESRGEIFGYTSKNLITLDCICKKDSNDKKNDNKSLLS